MKTEIDKPQTNKYIFVSLSFLIIVNICFLIFVKNNDDQKYKKNEDILTSRVAELEKQVEDLSTNKVAQLIQTNTKDQTQNNIDKININTADQKELEKIPSIGPVKANDIIKYRDTNNGFKTIEEIKNIKGIGNSTFEKIKNYITI